MFRKLTEGSITRVCITSITKICIILVLMFAALFSKGHALSVDVAYIFEADAGINFYNNSVKKVQSRYGLKDISDTVALSYTFKSGVLLEDRWKLLLSLGFAKRQNFEYPSGYIRYNESILEVHRQFRFGLDTQYSFFPYSSKFNIALGLENALLLRTIRITQQQDANSEDFPATTPLSLRKYEYSMAAQLKIYYRITKNSAFYTALDYITLFPSLENYPQLLFGVDISLYFNKKK